MRDSIWQILMIVVIANWLIYVAAILPKVREKRSKDFRDKGAGPGNPLKILMAYKELCEKDNESTIWFQVQICLIFVFVLFCVLGILGK